MLPQLSQGRQCRLLRSPGVDSASSLIRLTKTTEASQSEVRHCAFMLWAVRLTGCQHERKLTSGQRAAFRDSCGNKA